MADQIQFRRGTAAQWAAANPVLGSGELGYETDTKYFKLGDGVTAWNSLDYGYEKYNGKPLVDGYLLASMANGTKMWVAPYAHPGGDGNLHLPITSTDNAGKLLVAGGSAGSFSWTSNLSTAINECQGTDVASASTVDLAAATGNFLNITGTTTITSFGTAQAGAVREVRFADILTLTHNNSAIVLPGADDITTAAGDVARFRSTGSGVWVCVGYMRADGSSLGGGGGGGGYTGVAMQLVTPNDNQESNQVKLVAEKTTTTIYTLCPPCTSTNIWVFRFRAADSTWLKIADYFVTGDTTTTIASTTFAIGDKAMFRVNGNANNLPWVTVEIA